MVCYAPPVARGVRALPIGWDLPIPDAVWPEALLSAVRQDPGALGSSRVINTLRRWQAQAREDTDPKGRREARRLLEAVGRALVGEPETDDLLAAFDAEGVATALPDETDDGTQDAFQLPPKPRLRRGLDEPRPARRVRLPTARPDEGDTDSRVYAHKPVTGASSPPEPEFEDDENPTTAFQIEAPPSGLRRRAAPSAEGLAPPPGLEPPEWAPPPPPGPPPLPPEALREARGRGASSGPAAVDAPEATAIKAVGPPAPPAEVRPPEPAAPKRFDEDDKPTRHIPVPEEILRHMERTRRPAPEPEAEARSPMLRRLESAEHALAEVEASAEPERTQMALYPPRPPTPVAPVVVPQNLTDDLGSDLVVEPAPDSRSMPKAGVIRRRPREVRPTSAPRPRAAMHHVRAMYGALWSFAEELVPLSYERRSRRFWARWREVAGDRGVRRDFVEDLLRTAADTRTLVCELIGEAHQVDVRSVYTLVDKLVAEGPVVSAVSPEGDGPTRIPLVGASVRPDRDPK